MGFVLSHADPTETGLCYLYRVTDMQKTEEAVKGYGLKPISIWSTANKDHIMTPEQLAARESILNDYTIPEAYNLLIINASSETSIKIKSRVDYAVINSKNNDTQVQVRGRINSDLKRLYLPTTMDNLPEIPDEFLGVRLFTEDKDRLCEFLNLRNKDGTLYKWPSVKTTLIENDYGVAESRQDNRRYAVLTKGP